MRHRKKRLSLSIEGESDEFKGGFYVGQEDRSSAIAKTLLSQGWNVEFVAKTVMVDVGVVETIKRLMEEGK